MISDGANREHSGRNPRRTVQFVNRLDSRLSLLEYEVDFPPLASIWVAALRDAIERAKGPVPGESRKALIAGMLEPATKLKAGGTMCGYPLVVRISDTLISFLGLIAGPDEDALEVVAAFHTALDAVLTARITGFGGKHGDELVDGLEAACLRYLEHHPENRHGVYPPV